MIKYTNYINSSIDTEINNYLYFLNEVCLDKKDVRRYVTSILRLYEKLNSLPADYSNEDINSNRTLRKSSRYINKIKRFVKKIKSVDPAVFKEAADKLFERNGESNESYKNRYSKNNWGSEQISRTLSGDISGIIKRKRKNIISSIDNILDSSETIYFDDYNENEVIEGIDEIASNDTEETASDTDNLDSTDKIVSDIKNLDSSEKNISDTKNLDSTENNISDTVNNSISLENKLNVNEAISYNNDYYVSDKSSDYVKRILIKKELIELKKEIDQNEDLFIDIDHISLEQRNVIKSYMDICEKYKNIDSLFRFIYDGASSSDIVNFYEKMYDFTGFLISEMFEHIIHLSKISCDFNSENKLYEEKYIMDDSVVDVFGKYDLFIAKVQNYVMLINKKYGNILSSSDKDRLSKILWEKYRLDDINPSSIKEAVSLDLMSFVNENPFTLVQTMSLSKRKKESYKKYDLDKILENVDYNLEKYIPELFKSIKNKIMKDSILSDEDKEHAVSNIIVSFSKFIAEINGLSDYSNVSHDYLISYIMNKVFSVPEDLEGMLKESINNLFIEEKEKYNSLSFFDKIVYRKRKPNVSIIENRLREFTQKIDNISFSEE